MIDDTSDNDTSEIFVVSDKLYALSDNVIVFTAVYITDR